MRRSDREVTEIPEILKIIEKCEVCHLALSDNNIPYIIPMNFGYEYTQGRLTLYFHGANEGKKHDIIAKNSAACFEMDCSHKLIKAGKASEYTMGYESVIGNGIISYIIEKDEKIKACDLIMKQYEKEREFDFQENILESVTLFKLSVSELTGKRNLPVKRGSDIS